MKILATNGQPNAIRYGASYKSNTNLAANTPETVFAPGSNVNGAYVWEAGFVHSNAGGMGAAFLAKTSAPATVLDGDVVCGMSGAAASGASNLNFGQMPQPVFVPAGKGLYFISTNAENNANRHALFTLL